MPEASEYKTFVFRLVKIWGFVRSGGGGGGGGAGAGTNTTPTNVHTSTTNRIVLSAPSSVAIAI